MRVIFLLILFLNSASAGNPDWLLETGQGEKHELQNSKYYRARFYQMTRPYWNHKKYFWGSTTLLAKNSLDQHLKDPKEECLKPRPYKSCSFYDQFLTKVINRPEIQDALKKEMAKENPESKEILSKPGGEFKYTNGELEFVSSLYGDDVSHAKIPHLIHGEIEYAGESFLTTAPTTELIQHHITRDAESIMKNIPSFSSKLSMGKFALKLKASLTLAALVEAYAIEGWIEVMVAPPHTACKIKNHPNILLNPPDLLSPQQRDFLEGSKNPNWNAMIDGVDKICFAYCDGINQYIQSQHKEHPILDCVLAGEKQLMDYFDEKLAKDKQDKEIQKSRAEYDAKRSGYKIDQDGSIKFHTITLDRDQPASTRPAPQLLIK